ncbi:MAG TPA: hypothetical protein VMR29_10810 [Candidatus Binatia bacterium]|nr:hypothetical protein [Candidatus Binatia bacterium]
MPRRDRATVESDILTTIASMPFGGDIHVNVGGRNGGEPVTLEQVAKYLAALRATLERHAKICQEEHEELRELRANVAAVRSLFGGRP